jgi:hypothetical protein
MIFSKRCDGKTDIYQPESQMALGQNVLVLITEKLFY